MRSVSESLAGRVGVIEMSPFLWCELHRGCVSPFIQRLVSGVDSPRELLEDMDPVGSDAEAADYWFRGGYPEPWLTNSPRSSRTWMERMYGRTFSATLLIFFPG